MNLSEDTAAFSKRMLRDAGADEIVLHNGAGDDPGRDEIDVDGLSFVWFTG